MEKEIWFKSKKYGWGWCPCSWQGWLIMFIWISLFIFSLLNWDHEGLKNILFIFLITVILILICYKKGEKPKWRWG